MKRKPKKRYPQKRVYLKNPGKDSFGRRGITDPTNISEEKNKAVKFLIREKLKLVSYAASDSSDLDFERTREFNEAVDSLLTKLIPIFAGTTQIKILEKLSGLPSPRI